MYVRPNVDPSFERGGPPQEEIVRRTSLCEFISNPRDVQIQADARLESKNAAHVPSELP